RTNQRTTEMAGKNIFERLAAGRPTASTKQEASPAQLLLDWLQRWDKPYICGRDICRGGPGSIRNRKIAVSAAETLVKFGWLVPLRPHQRNMHKWQIVQRPPIVNPRVSESQQR